jgi:dTDP-4-amino-4,6-dideoxygalactose transaminase
LHDYYRDQFGWTPEDCPVATAEWSRLISLPLFPDLTPHERHHVVSAVIEICRRNAG